MLVKELIAELQALPQDLLLIKSGYEGGLDEIGGASLSKIRLNVNTAWYYGPHEQASNDDPVDNVSVIEAVYIG